jgi:hypothetical protein
LRIYTTVPQDSLAVLLAVLIVVHGIQLVQKVVLLVLLQVVHGHHLLGELLLCELGEEPLLNGGHCAAEEQGSTHGGPDLSTY